MKKTQQRTASKNDPEFLEFLKNYITEPSRKNCPIDRIKKLLVPKECAGTIKNQKIIFRSPHVGGVPITYVPGDEVTTKDGRKGITVDSIYLIELASFPDGIPTIGHFAVKVQFEDHCEYHIRQTLRGKRFRTVDDRY